MKRTIAVFVTALTVLTTGTILGASVAPTHLEGSSNAGKECTDVYPNVEGLQQLKIEGATPEDPFPGSGNYNDGTLFVSIVMPSATGTSANSIDWTSNIDVLGVVVKDGTDGANWYDYSPAGSQGDDNLITPADGRRGISHVSFCYVPGGADAAADLTVEKTAVPAFTRTFDWTIDKSADTATVYSAGGGESSEVEYTITVTKLAGVDSAWSVSGSITVTNPNPLLDDVLLTGVTDSVNNGGVCTVDTTGGLTVPGGGTKSYPYSCSYAAAPSPAAGKNTATVSWGAQTLASGAELAASSASFDKTFDFASASPTLVNNSINVDDSNGGSWAFSNSGSVSYIETFNDPEGTCTEHTNTATIRELPTKTDSVTVSDCQGSDLIVTKTAEASFDRSYQWEIEKDVDETYIELRPGDTEATFNYTVEVSHNDGTDGNWKVTGVITVENPNDWQDVTIDSLTDSIDNGGDCSIDFAATMTVEKSDSNEYPYECTYEGVPDSDAFTNTATASWDAEAYNTPNGSDDGTAEGAFDEPTTKIDECIDVSDDLYGGALGTVCVGDVDLTFNYSNDVPAPELGDCVTVNNTASFATTDDANDTDQAGSSGESVDVCTYNAPSTIGYWKTHMHVCVAREKQATAGCSNNGPFTGQYLPQTLGNFNVNTEAKALAIFNGNKCSSLSTGSNALACLAAQLLATKLNIANSSNPSCISATVTAADAFLISKSYAGPTGSYTLTAAQRATAITLKTALDNYNNNGC